MLLNMMRVVLVSVIFLNDSIAFADSSTDLIELQHKPSAPAFSLPDMDNKMHKLTDYLGKPVIVSFWATWCPPCRAEIPAFNRAWAKIKDEDIAMLAININEGQETIESFTKEYPIDFTILRDEAAGQLQNWNMTGLPTTFVIDAKGRIVYQAMGEREWDNDIILNKIRSLKQETISPIK
jgi:peroxiredoxin